MSKVKLIFNPMADRGRSGQSASDLRAIVDEFGGADWVGTEYPSHATELAARAGLDGYDRVVALGGDGTVHEVINGLMRLAPPHRPRLGVVPIGSGNDFAYGAGVSMNAAEAMRRVFAGKCKRVDVLSIQDNHGRVEYVDNTVGIGFDAAVNIQSRRITRLYGFAMYLTATVRTIIENYDAPRMTLDFDGTVIDRNVLMLTIGNGPREGGGFTTTPQSKLDDGLLDYMWVEPISRPTMFRLLPEVMKGTHGRFKFVHFGTFKNLHLQADRAIPIHIDGELFAPYEADVRELTVKLEAGAIELVC